jgi:hypothetical protein
MISGKMKLLSAVVGAAALVATPALASKTNKKRYQVSPNANASQTQRGFDVNAVYSWDGRYRGSDPDPNIRFQLMRDQNLPRD